MIAWPRHSALGVAITAVVLAAALPGLAQTGPELLLRPWHGYDEVELQSRATFYNQGSTDNAGADFQMQVYEITGRYRYDLTTPFNTAVGFDLAYFDLHTSDPALPQRLVDQSIAVGLNLPWQIDGWDLALIAGAGYAGNNPFADGDACYARADLIARRKLSDTQTLDLMLDYHGNRTILPDVPLPGIAWSNRYSDTLQLTLGLPVSSVHWEMLPKLTLEAQCLFLANVNATLKYEFVEGLAIYGSFRDQRHAFTLNEGSDRRRLFLTARQAEVGLEWRPISSLRAYLAGGYAFDQEFETGWDARDLHEVADLSDEPYFRAGLEVRF